MKYKKTASRIKEAMSDMNISQQELADKSNIGKSSISHYVNGSNEPGNKSAYALAKVLNVNPAWLMGLDVPKHTESIRIDAQIVSSEKALRKANVMNIYDHLSPERQEQFEDYLKYLASKDL